MGWASGSQPIVKQLPTPDSEEALFFRIPAFREHLVSNLKYNQEGHDFWEADFAARNKREQEAQLDAARTRAQTLLGHPEVRDIVGCRASTIDFGEVSLPRLLWFGFPRLKVLL